MEGLIPYFYFMLININLNSLLWQGAALESLQMDSDSASSLPFLCCQLEIKKQRQEKSKGVLLPHFILFRASLGLAIQMHGVQGSHCQDPMGCLMTRQDIQIRSEDSYLSPTSSALWNKSENF